MYNYNKMYIFNIIYNNIVDYIKLCLSVVVRDHMKQSMYIQAIQIRLKHIYVETV